MNNHKRVTPQTATRSLARPLAVTHSDTVSRLSASRNDATVGCCGFLRAVDTWGRSRWCAGACPPATVLVFRCQKKPCKTSWTLADCLVIGDLGIVMIILDDSVCSRSDILTLNTQSGHQALTIGGFFNYIGIPSKPNHGESTWKW